MAKYRKKPIVVDAVLWTGDLMPVAELLGRATYYTVEKLAGDLALYMPSFGGIMRADVGDYIIMGVKGELYPCKPDVFAATYEAV